MECALKKQHSQGGTSVCCELIAHCCELIAHDYIAEAERPRRADFRRPVRSEESELSANARSPTGGGVLLQRIGKGASEKHPGTPETCPARGGEGTAGRVNRH